MNNIHLIGGEKGGVGKSLMARLLAQYFIDHSIPFVGFDSDRSHGALLRFYEGFASPVVIDRYESMDAIAEAAAEQPTRRVLVDLAAQTHEPLARWMDDSGLFDLLSELGLSMRYWHVMDSGRDSTDLLKRLLDRFGERLRYVVVLNELRGDDFGILERSGEKERARAAGADFLSLPRLHEAAMTKIDATNTSFWAASKSENKQATGLGLLERQRVKMWMNHAYQEIAKLDV
jgi:hypothetical protein